MVGMSDSTGEVAVASESGLVVIYRMAVSTTNVDDALGQALADLSLLDPMPSPIAEAQGMLFKFTGSKSDTAIARPYCVLSAHRGGVTTIRVSDIGFVAIGYDSGYLIFIDLRGPAIFYANSCDRLETRRRDSVFRKSTTPKLSQGPIEYASAISIMSLSVESRLSLVVVVGTNTGRVINFELLKEQTGAYTALLVNVLVVPSGSSVRAILACNSFGEDASATGIHLSAMHTDTDSTDCLMLVSEKEVVSFRGLADKIASTAVRASGRIVSAKLLTTSDLDGVILGVGIEPNVIELFSVPDLQPIRALSFASEQRLSSPHLQSNGDIIFMEDTNNLVLFNVFGHGGKEADQPTAALFDALKQPASKRPTISSWAWVTGTQYVRASDLDLLLSGGERPLSKRVLERLAADERQRILIERSTASRDKVANRAAQQSLRNAKGNDRDTGRNTFGTMQAYGEERGERVSQVNELYENMSKASGEWLSEIDKLASNAKKTAGKAALKSFLGF